ncbi:MAG: hypothetical protein MHPSP_004708, partial [Paramarteilia canceri]
FYGYLQSTNDLCVNHKIDVSANVVNPDFRGYFKVLLRNHSNENYSVKVGDIVAQLVFKKYASVNFQCCSDLTETARGDKGFGST